MGSIGKRPSNPDIERWERHEEFVRLREEERRKSEERQKQYQREQRKKRKVLTKSERLIIYGKYDGRCAYCGCELEYKDMQIDHAVAIQGGDDADNMIAEGTMNEFDNLMPACRQCNFYKGTNDIEGFRSLIGNTLIHTCTDNFQAKLALKYGIIQFNDWDGKFYFEKLKKK